MPAPHKFTRKLHEVLGNEAAEAMADWMNHADENSAETRRDIADFRQTVRADFAELRQEMNTKFADLREEMNTKFADVREEMRVGFARVEGRFAAAESAAAQRHADFMKWTMGFWAVSLLTYVG